MISKKIIIDNIKTLFYALLIAVITRSVLLIACELRPIVPPVSVELS